eukprot:g668.t1
MMHQHALPNSLGGGETPLDFTDPHDKCNGDLSRTNAYGTPIESVRQRRFSPYEMNGGTALGIAGKDFVVVASDTRLSSGYSILTRNSEASHKLTSKAVIATGGCRTDAISLHKILDIRMQQYKDAHQKEMQTDSIAQLLSNTLYYRRFFPFYAFNIVGGIDKDGKGAVYTYDAIGSFERVQYASQGAGQKLMIPILDNVVGHKNRHDTKVEYKKDEIVELVKDVFITAGEREIMVGDSVVIHVITKDGIETTTFDLKKD